MFVLYGPQTEANFHVQTQYLLSSTKVEVHHPGRSEITEWGFFSLC